MKLCGIRGRPFLDLSPFVDVAELRALDDEISPALPFLPSTYTGGTLKWMGVVAPFQRDDGYRDAMEAIRAMSDADLAQLVALGDDPTLDLSRRHELAFGDETDHPFTRAQELLLKTRHGVYFPWKVCVHLLENERWEDKHLGAGKDFTEATKRLLPRTVRFLRALPFVEIGRAVLFGIEANDHAPFHRDSEPGETLSIPQSISLDPRGDKRLVLCDEAGGSRTVIDAPVHWFNDMDFHGVEPAKHFRYSIRVDGLFTADFVKRLDGHFR